jgi:hypothetical protein
MIDRLISSEAKHLGTVDADQLEQRRDLLRQTVRRATEMSDVQFALNQKELADAIRLPDRKQELIIEIDDRQRERREPGRTARFLLNGAFAEVLKVRYEQLATD